MCDFKPGDEVVCVDADYHGRGIPSDLCFIREGGVYVVSLVLRDVGGVHLDGVKARNPFGYNAIRFRKVQRRDLSAWLKTSVGNTDKLDKRQTKKVRA